MFFRRRERETLERLRVDVDSILGRLERLNTVLADAEDQYQRSRTLHARLAKQEQRRAATEEPQATHQAPEPAMNPLALALLRSANGGDRE